MTETSMVESTTTMIYPINVVDRSDAKQEYFKLDNIVYSVNEMYNWMPSKVVDRHHITKNIRGECEYKLEVLRSNNDVVVSWYVLHECAHAIAIKLKNFVNHGKFFHQVLIELMEIFVADEKYDAFITCEATYKKRIVQRWSNWINWRKENGNHFEIFPATFPVFRESQRRASRCN